jgi:hypothetical protein
VLGEAILATNQLRKQRKLTRQNRQTSSARPDRS